MNVRWVTSVLVVATLSLGGVTACGHDDELCCVREDVYYLRLIVQSSTRLAHVTVHAVGPGLFTGDRHYERVVRTPFYDEFEVVKSRRAVIDVRAWTTSELESEGLACAISDIITTQVLDADHTATVRLVGGGTRTWDVSCHWATTPS